MLIYDRYPVKRNPFDDLNHLPREVAVEYAVQNDGITEFRSAEVILDETHALSVSGSIKLKIGADAENLKIDEDLPECLWLRIRVLEQGCEEIPRITGVFEKTVALIQRKTLCTIVDEKAEQMDFEMSVDLFLAQNGGLMAFVRDSGGWQPYDKISVFSQGETVVKFRDLPDDLNQEESNIRLILFDNEFRRNMLLKGSNGLPCQQFRLNCDETVLPEQLRIMVREHTDSGAERWLDWSFAPDLLHAGPLDRVFYYDAETEALIFGDNEHGMVPEAGKENILIVSCAVTSGIHGNILADSLRPLDYNGAQIFPHNYYPSSGGAEADSIKLAIEKFKISMSRRVKAVTAADYEEFAYHTPGLRVLGAKAFPLYDAENKLNGGESPATVTVVVMPYNESRLPLPNERFLKAVRSNLEKYRLITTNVKVIAPTYIKISIYAEVVLQNERQGRTLDEIRQKVECIFDIQKKIAAGIRLNFVQTVNENSIISKITEVLGVSRVKRLTLNTKNSESRKDRYGNIELPPYAIPYLGDLEIRQVDFI
jgi:hypothetical protein